MGCPLLMAELIGRLGSEFIMYRLGCEVEIPLTFFNFGLPPPPLSIIMRGVAHGVVCKVLGYIE